MNSDEIDQAETVEGYKLLDEQDHQNTETTVEDYRTLDSGGKLSADEAAKLELVLKSDEGDVNARLLLIGFYFHEKVFRGSLSAYQARQPHLIWMVDNQPTRDVCGSPYLSYVPPSSIKTAKKTAKLYSEAKKHWLKQIDNRDGKPQALSNAGHFFEFHGEEKLANKLFARAVAMAPDDLLLSIKCGLTKIDFNDSGW
jgi:hypothetical protein